MNRTRSLVLCLLLPLAASAREIREEFDSRRLYASGTAIWNQTLGQVHPTLNIVGAAGGALTRDVPLGDGSHGAFTLARYSTFSVNGTADTDSHLIRIDTDAYPILQVTEFVLEVGWRLETIGNKPLIIYSLSDVRIAGEIHCEGGDGQPPSGATPGAGGVASCGGANGGTGGLEDFGGDDGGDADPGVTGGWGGNHTGATGVGGGGGGSWNTTSLPSPGPGANVSGGLAGDSWSEPDFTTIAGGAGGGGGSGSDTEPGAGGGAGGGVVIIHAARDFHLGTSPGSTTGFIYAHGGQGGTAATGGPGGGGAGGSIQVFAGRDIHIWNSDADGASQAGGGLGGGAGGIGGPGRSWFASVTYNNPTFGFHTPPEDVSFAPGTAEFEDDPQFVITKPIDLLNTHPDIISFTSDPVSPDFTIEAAGSDDGFIHDDTGWTLLPTDLTGKRYLRFRLTVTTSTPAAPTPIDALVVNYTPHPTDTFTFTAAGCGRLGGADSRQALPLFLLGLLLSSLKFVAQKQERVERERATTGSTE